MKAIQILKIAVIPVLTLSTLLTTMTTALADYLTSEGAGGNYQYELWLTEDNQYYYLKIWSRDANKQSEGYGTTQYFTSSQDALNHFDCYYADQSLPQCPK
jgi:hypothetical protein